MLMKILSIVKEYYTGYQNKEPIFEDFKELYRTIPKTPNPMKSNKYQIWVDTKGARETCDRVIGISYGETFQEACDYFFLTISKDPEDKLKYNSKTGYYGTLKLYEKIVGDTYGKKS